MESTPAGRYLQAMHRLRPHRMLALRARRGGDAHGVLDAVARGEVDVAVSALSVTSQRERRLDLTHAYHEVPRNRLNPEDPMANFDTFLPTLLRFEGGYVDDPADPGGATNKGITMHTYERAAEPLLGRPPTPESFAALSNEDAGTLYKRLYWDRAHADEFESQALADIVVDFCVNAGCATGIKLLQEVLNAAGAVPALAVEGVMGPATLRALRSADPSDLLRRYRDGRIAYYNGLVADKPQLGRFLKGWLNRVNAVT
jgi:hypothetical protein